jgi:hypothetical protein
MVKKGTIVRVQHKKATISFILSITAVAV